MRETLALMPGLQVLAGEAGLERLVQSVGVLEGPDALEFMKAGDLVLTALWAIRNDRDAQLRLIPELAGRGAAGLAIKLRYLGEPPREVLEQANSLAFPLLQLSPDLSFSEVALPIIRQITGRQAALLQRQEQAHKAVMLAVREVRGLDQLAQTLADLLEGPVLVRDAGGQTLASGRWPGAPDPAQLAPLEVRPGEPLASAGGTVYSVASAQWRGRRLLRLLAPIRRGTRSYGEVLLWQMERSLGEPDLNIFDSVVTVIALELFHRRALVEVERRYRDEFLAALLSRQAESEDDLLPRGRRFGWDLTRPHYALACKLLSVGEGDDAEAYLALQDRVYDAAVGLLGADAMVGQAELHTAVLLSAPARGNPVRDGEAVARRLLAEVGAGEPLLRLSVGLGSVQQGVAGPRRSFQEARQAIRVGERVYGACGVFSWAQLGLYQFLAGLGQSQDLQHLVAGVQQLAAYDAAHRTDLVRTLEAYFACTGNVRRASEQLYAHYNTVLYRLQRVEQITGRSLENPDDRLYLQVGLKAARLHGI